MLLRYDCLSSNFYFPRHIFTFVFVYIVDAVENR